MQPGTTEGCSAAFLVASRKSRGPAAKSCQARSASGRGALRVGGGRSDEVDVETAKPGTVPRRSAAKSPLMPSRPHRRPTPCQAGASAIRRRSPAAATRGYRHGCQPAFRRSATFNLARSSPRPRCRALPRLPLPQAWCWSSRCAARCFRGTRFFPYRLLDLGDEHGRVGEVVGVGVAQRFDRADPHEHRAPEPSRP